MQISLSVVPLVCVLILLPVRTLPADVLPDTIQAFLSKNCLECHGPESPDGDLCLDDSQGDWSDPAFIRKWELVLQMVDRNIMPPVEQPRPSASSRSEFMQCLGKELESKSAIGGTELRRLSRREYVNSIRKTFDIPDFNAPDSFPPDSESQGFDNQGSALVLAPAHIEALVESATRIADSIFPRPSQPVEPRTITIPADQLVISYSSACLIEGGMRLASSGTIVNRNATWPPKFEAPVSGEYQVRVVAASTEQPGAEAPRLQVSTMQPGDRNDLQEKFVFDVPSSHFQQLQRHELRFAIEIAEGETLAFRYANGPFIYDEKQAFSELLFDIFTADPKLAAAWEAVGDPARGGSGWQRVKETLSDPLFDKPDWPDPEKQIRELANRFGKDAVKTGETLVYKYFEEGPFISIYEVDISGPFHAQPEKSQQLAQARAQRFFGPLPETFDHTSVSRLITHLLTQVFRRPPEETEISAYVQLVMQESQATGRVEDGLHLAIRTALISPAFLYRDITHGELSNFELAGRLAFFLTSAPPDDQLMLAAENGQLSDSQQLKHHAKRLLFPPSQKTAKNTKAPTPSQFAQDFTGAWLGLASLDSLMPDTRLIKDFDSTLRSAMLDEVGTTFQYLLNENLPTHHLIAPEFVVTDPNVGWQIYELENFKPVKKGQTPAFEAGMQQVAVERFGRRGGLLAMPAVMMATANGVDTQPVLRGVWMLDNILGRPSPEPPSAVPALTPDTTGTNSPKARLAAHTNQPSCALCHQEIDPLGFVLENFDPIGRWREFYPHYQQDEAGKQHAMNGGKIDSTGRLPDGTELADVSDLKQWLYENPEPFVCCLAEKLMVYATGRNLNYRERRLIARRVQEQAADHYPIQDLILSLIDSPVFKTK